MKCGWCRQEGHAMGSCPVYAEFLRQEEQKKQEKNQPVPDQKTCSSCGAVAPATASFCPNCGAKI